MQACWWKTPLFSNRLASTRGGLHTHKACPEVKHNTQTHTHKQAFLTKTSVRRRGVGRMGAQGSCMHMTSWFKEIMSCNISEEAISTQVEVRGYVFFFSPTCLHRLLVWSVPFSLYVMLTLDFILTTSGIKVGKTVKQLCCINKCVVRAVFLYFLRKMVLWP